MVHGDETVLWLQTAFKILCSKPGDSASSSAQLFGSRFLLITIGLLAYHYVLKQKIVPPR